MEIFLYLLETLLETYLFRRQHSLPDLPDMLHFNVDDLFLEDTVKDDTLLRPYHGLEESVHEVVVDGIPDLTVSDLDACWTVELAYTANCVLECFLEFYWLSKAWYIQLKQADLIQDGDKLHQLSLTGACISD